MNRFALLLCLLPIVGCAQERHGRIKRIAAANDQPGSYGDLRVADDDLQGLEQLLNSKWTYFLIEMDKYNQVRKSSTNDAMVKRMQLVFAETFTFHAYYPDGRAFGTTQGDYSPRSWLEAQKVDLWNILHGTLLVPNYLHVLRVEEPGKRVVLEGYHEHLFSGKDIRLLVGESRQLAFEILVFEKVKDAWRITNYEETVWSASGS